jgi:hypothetical protein
VGDLLVGRLDILEYIYLYITAPHSLLTPGQETASSFEIENTSPVNASPKCANDRGRIPSDRRRGGV